MPDDTAAPDRPLERLRVLAKQDELVTPLLRHIEGFTLEGLLTYLWHGDPQAERVVLMCGGAVAVNAGCMLRSVVAGVVTLSTQSAGCESAAALQRPLLLLHGDRDELIPPMASEMVCALAGGGDVELLPGAGHLLVEAADHLRTRLQAWITDVLARPLEDAHA